MVTIVLAAFRGDTLLLRLPLQVVGDMNFAFAGVVGTRDRETDLLPNTGSLVVHASPGAASFVAASQSFAVLPGARTPTRRYWPRYPNSGAAPARSR